MKQLVVSSLPEPGSPLRLGTEQSHYLLHVRRLQPGANILCTDGNGRRGTAVLETIDETGCAVLRMSDGEDGAAERRRGVPTAVYVATLKGKKTDLVVRQLTELGIARIVPFVATRSVSRPDARDLSRKRDRWREIAREATQQSGRSELPAVEPAASLRDALALTEPGAAGIAFHESADRSVELPIVREEPETPAAIVAAVGPEGGFAPEEVAVLAGAGWHIRRLDLPVLRAETAALVAGTLVQLGASEYTAISHPPRMG